MSTVASAVTEVAPAVKTQVQSNYGKLPLSFEANQGQTDAQVKFLSRGHGYALFLTPSEAVLSLKKPKAKTSPLSAMSSSAPEAIGADDAFVVQFTANGDALRYSTYLGGDKEDGGADIAVDELGQAFVTGWTELSDFPTVRALQPTSGGQVDTFVAKFTANGATFRYATYLGGGAGDLGLGIAVDKQDQAYVTGFTNSGTFPTTVNAVQLTFGGGGSLHQDAFVAKIGSNDRHCEQGKKCKDDHKGHAKNMQKERISELNMQKELSSELTLRDHLSNICQSGLKAFACRLAHSGIN